MRLQTAHHQTTSNYYVLDNTTTRGAAALATFMTYYFGDETSERNISICSKLTHPDELEVKKKRGFSL